MADVNLRVAIYCRLAREDMSSKGITLKSVDGSLENSCNSEYVAELQELVKNYSKTHFTKGGGKNGSKK